MNNWLIFLKFTFGVSLCSSFGIFPTTVEHNVLPRTVSTLNKYTPTNAWFQNWLVGSGENPIHTYPYIIKASRQGFTICYPSQIVNQNAYTLEVFLANWILSVRENFAAPNIDQSTVDSDFFNLGAKINFGDKFSAQITRGFASIIVNLNSVSPILTTIHAILTFETVSDRAIKVSMNNNQVWLIQSEKKLSWTRDNSQISGSVYTGWIKISIITSQTGEQNLINFHDSLITNGHVSYSVNRNEQNVQIKVDYNGQGLYYLLPHVINPQQTTLISGANAKGIKGSYILSKGFGYSYNLPLYPKPDNSNAANTIEKKNKILNALRNDINLPITSKDPYFGGKELARTARLIEIADLVNDNQSKEKLKDTLINELDLYWFGINNNTPALVYEPTWGGIVSRQSVGSAEEDFGIYYYNDHHFHFGYFVYAAAILAKFYPDYYNNRKEYFNLILSDYAGSCMYKELPCRPRNKDPFLGHSYASGLFEFADSKNQESTSEAINSYFAVRELGKITGNQTLEDLGDYLLSSEIHATIVYWQIRKNSPIYSEPFSKNGVVGILWETKVDYATWFGGNVEFIYGIQMLPFTEITPSYLSKEWLSETRPVWSKALTSSSIEEEWKGFMLMADAIVDPNRSGLSNEIHKLSVYDNGNTQTNTLYFYYFVGGSPSGDSGQVTGISSSSTTTTTKSTTICSGFGCESEFVDVGKPDPNCGSNLYGCHNLAGNLVGCYDPQTTTCFFGGNMCDKPLKACINILSISQGVPCYDPNFYKCVNGNLYPI